MHMESPRRPLDRRMFLGASVGLAAGLSACGGKEAGDSAGMSSTADKASANGGATLPEGLDAEDFIVHGTNPWTMESQRREIGGAITPTDKVFVRGNLPFPPASIIEDRDAWSLEVAGVANPRSISLAELKSLGAVTVAAVLQCSGNGRKFFEHGPSGSPWGVGAAANVLWTGVPLKTVIAELGGLSAGAMKFITGTGGEPIPEALKDQERKVIVERSIPIEKALADGILAWDLNSEPIPLSHGGPLRLVIPGYYGVNNVKYLKRLAATEAETDAKIQAKSYRVRPIGVSGAPDQPSMFDMNVKSWITGPLGDESPKAGRHMVTCVAFSGESPVASVEITTDGGKTWKAAEAISPMLGRYAWTQYAIQWDARPGQHLLASRATDASGKVQPELRIENERGYAHNAWRDPGVTVEIA
ncbi:MAG: sulfite oxidase [Paracoccaceae bacterium]|jgi:sulfite oxidase